MERSPRNRLRGASRSFRTARRRPSGGFISAKPIRSATRRRRQGRYSRSWFVTTPRVRNPERPERYWVRSDAVAAISKEHSLERLYYYKLLLTTQECSPPHREGSSPAPRFPVPSR